MEERKTPPVQRGNIDGISMRKPVAENPQIIKSQAADKQDLKQQASRQTSQTKASTGKEVKPGKNWLVITLAVIIFLGLSAFAVYMGLQKKSDSGNPLVNSSTDNKQLIDQTLNDIDQLNDQTDNSGEGLSDEQLGL